ncbi:hypothetical protein [Francisella sp. TX07-6608]|uniref:hypothetical protein n=1 Tax=Francisella sp. TX07-6608 TaxID=573568 RepID=UPI0008F9C010|nr:hypothetical protein [Francisella sp. TX07-6608]OIN83469.1 hypothetical protein KX00_254 [Francisella sp. TX07-6608]
MIKFISKEVLKLAFSRGIDKFIELYNLQSNKNLVSETLGNLAMNVKNQGVHTNYISSSEVEQANRIKAILNRDGELDTFFQKFGQNLKLLQTESSTKCFITSHYSFIVLAVFHYASVIESVKNSTNDSYNSYLNMENLTAYYLTPNTRKKEVILNLYGIIGNALSSLNTSLLADTHGINDFHEHISDTEKLWAFLCSQGCPLNDFAKSFLDTDTFKKYSNLSKNFLLAKKNNSHIYNQKLVTETQKKIAEAFGDSQRLLQKFEEISNAIAAYNLKFDQNTSNAIDWKQSVSKLSTIYPRAILVDPVTQLMTGTGSLSGLKTIFPPSFITSLVTELGFKLIEISIQSKGYGVINRHGITGQLRSHLLKDYIDMISVFIKNNYYYIFSQENETNIIKCCNIVIDTVQSFYISYNKAIELLPNKNQNGSLYYYLDMYVNKDTGKIDKWNKSKLASIYK